MANVLRDVATEIERHVAAGGWDQPPRLYALVPTAELLEQEPGLAEHLGLAPGESGGASLTPIEQDELPRRPIDEVLAGIAWPAAVKGCALVQEVVVLPPCAEAETPVGDDEEALARWATQHPDRRDVRIAVAVLRGGDSAAALRVRAEHDDGNEDELLLGSDLVPGVAEALLATLA